MMSRTAPDKNGEGDGLEGFISIRGGIARIRWVVRVLTLVTDAEKSAKESWGSTKSGSSALTPERRKRIAAAV